jgi:hypothetical protein
MKKPLLVIGGLIGLILVAAVGWYLASPLFINNTVDEAFPVNIPSDEELAQMTTEEKDALEAQVQAASASMPDKVMNDAMPEAVSNAEPVTVVQGQFMDADGFHKGSGTASIYQLPDGNHILRFDDFEVTNGPDLHVLLAAHPNPATSDELHENYIDLGSLKGNIGSQNYEIPVGTDITQFKSVVIYCMPFHVFFSNATLE